MRVAIAFFGIPRLTEKCYPSIEEKILSQLPQNSENKIFFHLYNQKEIANPRSGEFTSIPEGAYKPFLGFNGELESPGDCLTRWKYEEIKKFGDTWNDNFASLKNLIHQLNSLYKVTSLIEKYSPDVVLFVRPDLIYHNNFPQKVFEFSYENPSSVFIPSWQWWGGYNDRFSICGRDIFKVYGHRIEQIFNFCQHLKEPLNAEKLVKFSLDRSNARVIPINLRASRARANGQIKKEKFFPLLGMGNFKNYIDYLKKKAESSF
ncbi:hypothetical protein [Pseudomonas citronellolis]|uniref:hypothetical protein n=1 Tax=Pseudomonas citronellolis TaxID=53408 RepID=UPI00106674B6|nr:hypothetical protein [Pseudomonas humi]